MKNKLLLGMFLFVGASVSYSQQAKLVQNKLNLKEKKQTTNIQAKALGQVVWHDNFDSIVSGPGLTTVSSSTWTLDNSGQAGGQYGWSIDNVYDGWWLTGSGAGVFASSSGGKFAELSNRTTAPSSSDPGGPATGVTYILTSGIIDVQSLVGGADAILSFEQDGALFNDNHEVLVSIDGTTWDPIYNNRGSKEGQTRYGSSSLADKIELDLTSYITASPSTVQIQFRWTTAFPTTPGDWVWVTYGWFVDDIKISTKPDYDLVSTYNFHHTDQYNYSQIPETQIAPIVFRAGVKNQGSQTLNGVKLMLDVNSGSSSIESSPITLNANTLDTLEATFTPSAIGTYTITQALALDEIDDNPSNNNSLPDVEFDVTSNIYAVDKGAPYTDYPLTSITVGGTPVVIDGVGTSYDIFADQEVHAIDFRLFTGTTIGAEVYGALYEVNPSYTQLSEYWTGPLVETDLFTLESNSQISQMHTLQFTSPYMLETGKTYLFLLKIASDTVHVAVGGETETSQSWLHGNHENEWGTFSDIPVVRANFDGSLSVAQNDVFGKASVFPNPATDKATVSFDLNNASNVTIEVTDITGKVVSEVALTKAVVGTNETEINTADFASGLYSVVIKSSDSSITRKLVVR